MRTQYLPVPVGGWNASVPLDLMQPTDAVQLINFIPRESTIEFRKGTQELTSSALATSVETLATHRQEDGTETLVAFADGKSYTINTSTGAATQKNSGYKNNRWQTVNFNDLLLCVNGADAPQQFDGTTFGNYSAAVSGATPEDLNGVVVFKGRCIYWENNSASFWYAAAGAYGGALTEFPLSLVTRQGGYVVECFSWTRDSGDGMDDLFVVIMSTGETLVYQGSDPGNASDWTLIGSFALGAPLAIRGSCNLGGDRVILTKDGFINLSTALQVGRMSENGNVSTKIMEAAKESAKRYGSLYGWEIFYHDSESLLMVNVPVEDGERWRQYCMNTNTGAWTQFKDINCVTFTEINGVLYGGCPDGHIRQIFTGASDDSVPIEFIMVPAFNSFGMPDRMKTLTFCTVQTNFVAKENIGLAGLADLETRAFGNAAVPDLTVGTLAEWDTATWDEVYWGDSDEIDNREKFIYDIPVSSHGYSLSVKIKIQSNIQTANIFTLRLKYKLGRSI